MHCKGQYWEPCFFSFTSTIYHKNWTLKSNFLLVILLYVVLQTAWKVHLWHPIEICLKYKTGHTNRKCHLIQIELNKHKRSCDCNGIRTHTWHNKDMQLNASCRQVKISTVLFNHLASLPSGFGFESRCSHLNFRYRSCFEQGVPWHSSNYRV